MAEVKDTFELLKNSIDLLPIGLLMFDEKNSLISWNKHAAQVLEVNEDDFKVNNLGFAQNQIIEILSSEQINERDLVGLQRPYKTKKIYAKENTRILVLLETTQESIGEMSHELRRPITNIKTLTESLLMGAKNDPEMSDKFLQNINAEVDRLTKLVNELINLSKVRAGKATQQKKKIPLKARVDDALKLLQSIADKSKTKLINEVPEGYGIFADQDQMDHVIQNLIENAIRYSPENSQVTVKTSLTPGSFQVDDTGIGIAETDIPKIFDRFYRIDRTRVKGSSGLGLSIVKNVIDLHGGKIEVKSKLGSGSSFIVHLPAQ